MTVVWTPPTHVVGGTGWASSRINEEYIDNLQFLHDGYALYVGTPTDKSATVLPQVANRAFACPIVSRDAITIAGLTWQANSHSGNIDFGVYDDDGNGTTASRLKSSGSVAMPGGSTPQTITFSSPQALEPYHKYWFAVAFSVASGANILGTDGPYSLLCKQMASAFPLPATFTFAALSNGISPCLIGLA